VPQEKIFPRHERKRGNIYSAQTLPLPVKTLETQNALPTQTARSLGGGGGGWGGGGGVEGGGGVGGGCGEGGVAYSTTSTKTNLTDRRQN